MNISSNWSSTSSHLALCSLSPNYSIPVRSLLVSCSYWTNSNLCMLCNWSQVILIPSNISIFRPTLTFPQIGLPCSQINTIHGDLWRAKLKPDEIWMESLANKFIRKIFMALFWNKSWNSCELISSPMAQDVKRIHMTYRHLNFCPYYTRYVYSREIMWGARYYYLPWEQHSLAYPFHAIDLILGSEVTLFGRGQSYRQIDSGTTFSLRSKTRSLC